MKLLKWILIFVVAFMVAWVLIFTFTQPPFAQGVPAKIFTYRTPSIPVYIYVAGAFLTGLLLGCSLALYNYITGSLKVRKISKKLRSVESELAVLKVSAEDHSVLPAPDLYGKPDNPPIDGKEGIIE
jgi:hypothetical protein